VTFASPKKSSWPRQAAIVVSESPNVHMLLRELLRSYAWTVIESTPSVERAIDMVRQGQAFLIIVDDTAQAPAVRHIRHLLSDPLAVCTPILSFLLEAHKHESHAIAKLGRPQIVDKPLTPSKFIPGFVNLVRNWEKEPLIGVRRANYQLIAGNEGAALKTLLKVAENDTVQALCAQGLALHLRRLGKIKEAETLLLNSLKRAPRELGTMMTLADLYLHAAMPRLAQRLLATARNTFNPSMCMLPDLVQASLLLGQVDKAVEHLYTMQRAGFREDETTAFLARLLIAEGRESEAEKVLNNNKAALKRIQSGWDTAEMQPMTAAG
jgi:Flp pilus assembly protein TadD